MVAEDTFIITECQAITLQSTTPLEQLHCCSEAPIIFMHNDQTLILSTDSVRENLCTLRTLLHKVLAGSLQLHNSLNNNIGYWFNQELTHAPGLAYDTLDGRKYWVGYHYKLWSYYYAAWLYNTPDKSIMLDITPIYPGIFSNSDITSTDAAYQEWLKTYKPYFIAEIPSAVAQIWLKQTDDILKTIDLNMSRNKP